jgi:hypothetical protein
MVGFPLESNGKCEGNAEAHLDNERCMIEGTGLVEGPWVEAELQLGQITKAEDL